MNTMKESHNRNFRSVSVPANIPHQFLRLVFNNNIRLAKYLLERSYKNLVSWHGLSTRICKSWHVFQEMQDLINIYARSHKHICKIS